MHVVRSTALTLLFLALLGAPLHAQNNHAELQIYGGAVFPIMDLAEGGWYAPALDLDFSETAMQDNVTFGVSAGYRFGKFQLEANVGLWPTSQYAFVSGAAGNVDISLRTDAKVLLAGGSFLYHFDMSGDVAIEPFFVAGAGVKKYSLDADEEFIGTVFTEPTTVSWNVGLGSKFPISPTKALRVEIRDYMSMFDFEIEGADAILQHDVVATVGLSMVVGSH